MYTVVQDIAVNRFMPVIYAFVNTYPSYFIYPGTIPPFYTCGPTGQSPVGLQNECEPAPTPSYPGSQPSQPSQPGQLGQPGAQCAQPGTPGT